MTVLTKQQALDVVRRAYGAEMAESIAPRLPDPVDLDDPEVADLLSELGLTREELFNRLGGEL